MAAKCSLVALFVVFCAVTALPEPGRWETEKKFNVTGFFHFNKSMYKDTIVSLKFTCDTKSADVNKKLMVGWVLRYSPCVQEYTNMEGHAKEASIISTYFDVPNAQLYPDYAYTEMEFIKVEGITKFCDGHVMYLPDKTSEKPVIAKSTVPESGSGAVADEGQVDKNATKREEGDKDVVKARQRREDKAAKPKGKAKETPAAKETPKATSATPLSSPDSTAATEKPPPVPMSEKVDEHHLAKVWKSGFYVLIVKIDSMMDEDVDVKVSVSMKGATGYISAVEWPLLIFYGIMGLVYIFYGLIWLVMLACNWRDLLRIQYWIGAVIFLGMLEKAVFYSDYQSVASNGNSFTEGAVVFAEIVSCVKRALARILVIIASLGFGIVKPRLGPTFHKVIAVGALYTLLATVEGCMRSLKPKGNQSNEIIYAGVPLAIVDACICYWVFYSLVQTLRQLRLRRNIVKLTLYRHFSNTLIFAVIASIIFMIWSIVQTRFTNCIKNWHELWIDEAFWHLLFSILLLVIMILWRPSSNNQRYAFSPLLDAENDDEEEEETMLNDAFEGMKMRGKQANGSPKQKQNTIEDDLKWVEENIPSALSDKAETLLESDEEIMTAKYEMSKMQ